MHPFPRTARNCVVSWAPLSSVQDTFQISRAYLIHCGTPRTWEPEEEKAMNAAKSLLSQSPVMAYFDVNAQTRIITDASPVGLGAILEQKQPDGTYRSAYYARGKLKTVETRYSQFEKEAFGIRWACQRFHLFIYGMDLRL